MYLLTSRFHSKYTFRNLSSILFPLRLFLVVCLAASGLAACRPAGGPGASSDLIRATPDQSIQPENDSTQYTIALVMKTLTNPFFVEMEKGARRAEAELGVHLVVKTAAQETSIEQQIEIVEDLIQDHVDAIVIAPGDSSSLVPVLKKAQDDGIVIINVDNRLSPAISRELGLVQVPVISVDNEMGAYRSAKYVSDQVVSPTEAIILEGIPSAKNAQDRKQGALRAFSENAMIHLVGTESAHWKIDEAYTVAQELFASHPGIGLVFCANDMMALGVIQYLSDTGKTGVKVAGFDALDEAVSAIKSGTLAATINQRAAEQGYQGVKYALEALEGKQLPDETLIDTLLINSETLSQ